MHLAGIPSTCKSGSFHAKQMDRNPGQSGYCEHVGWISEKDSPGYKEMKFVQEVKGTKIVRVNFTDDFFLTD